MLRHDGWTIFTCNECGYTTTVENLRDDTSDHLTPATFYRDTQWLQDQKDHAVNTHGAHRDREGCVTGGPTWTTTHH